MKKFLQTCSILSFGIWALLPFIAHALENYWNEFNSAGAFVLAFVGMTSVIGLFMLPPMLTIMAFSR